MVRTFRRNLSDEVESNGAANTLNWVSQSIADWTVPDVRHPAPIDVALGTYFTSGGKRRRRPEVANKSRNRHRSQQQQQTSKRKQRRNNKHKVRKQSGYRKRQKQQGQQIFTKHTKKKVLVQTFDYYDPDSDFFHDYPIEPSQQFFHKISQMVVDHYTTTTTAAPPTRQSWLSWNKQQQQPIQRRPTPSYDFPKSRQGAQGDDDASEQTIAGYLWDRIWG